MGFSKFMESHVFVANLSHMGFSIPYFGSWMLILGSHRLNDHLNWNTYLLQYNWLAVIPLQNVGWGLALATVGNWWVIQQNSCNGNKPSLILMLEALFCYNNFVNTFISTTKSIPPYSSSYGAILRRGMKKQTTQIMGRSLMKLGWI